jgi:hypothetical protein
VVGYVSTAAMAPVRGFDKSEGCQGDSESKTQNNKYLSDEEE